MSEDGAAMATRKDSGERLAYGLAILLVIIGLVNSMPGIPGFDQFFRDLTGSAQFSIRKYPYYYFHPIAFVLMMTIVALSHSIWRSWSEASTAKRFLGLFLDIALVVMAVVIALTYMNEIPAVCLADQITGDRARLIEEALKIEIENASLFGLPEPTTVDNPNCLNSVGGWLVAIMAVAVVVFLAYNVKVWGLPLVMVAIVVTAYTIGTVLVWYVFGDVGIGKYFVTKLGGEPRLLSDGFPRLYDALTSNSSGLLGRFIDIILNEIFPYLVLGSFFGTSAGGRSLIKLAFRWTRRLAGGPAHAAIVSSAMFGTISGGPVVNVLATGVLTIPMMVQRGFSRVFAGGVEAAASSGGSIMPPVMGVAAFVLAALTAVPYSQVIIAAIIPALAYFLCLFLSVVFQARKQKIEAIGEITPEMRLDRQDWLNLVMIAGPILLILALLLTSKESVGCGFFGWLFGAERTLANGTCDVTRLPWFLQLVQNAAGDVGSAGWWAVALLMVLVFLDPEMRARPARFLDAMSQAGILVSTLYLMFLAVSIIDFCLKFTGLPYYISLDVLGWLQGLDLGSGSALSRFLALAVTMLLAVLLGMGMPAVPAYINVSLLMGPVLAGLGISIFTANMFIFYYAVASAITPPVAIAAYAAASITRADPMATGLSAVRSGVVMFVIPFVFAFYPELLLIEPAIVDPASPPGSITYLPGYDGMVHWATIAWVSCRVVASLYLLASALARFDRGRLAAWEIGARLVLAALILSADPLVHGSALVVAAMLLAWHITATRRSAPPVLAPE